MTIENNWCALRVDNDKMHAYMCLKAPTYEENISVTEAFVVDFLNSQGISYGIDSAAIHAITHNISFGQYICVASGKPATRGADGYFDYKKPMQDMKKKPIVNEDGTVDYLNSFNLATISEGELMAEYVPPQMGSEGCDIYGTFLAPLGPGKEMSPLRGRGIKADENKTHYYAEYSGHIVMDGNHISIEKLYKINSDLDIEVGNIKFDGDVEVMGDVRSGLSIDTKGNVYIHGHVGACQINAGGNITIDKGTQGRDICHITAKGDIACKFVERCTIKAGGNIYADSVLNANLCAQKMVIITNKNGLVVGSEVYGMTGLIVKEAGNFSGTSTLLRAGLPREEYARANELEALIKNIDHKLNEFNAFMANTSHVKTDGDHLTDEQKKVSETRTKIMRAKIVLTSDRKNYSDELEILKERIKANAENSFINITGTIHAGVRIYIGANPLYISEAVKEVTYRLAGNAIEVTQLIDIKN